MISYVAFMLLYESYSGSTCFRHLKNRQHDINISYYGHLQIIYIFMTL